MIWKPEGVESNLFSARRHCQDIAPASGRPTCPDFPSGSGTIRPGEVGRNPISSCPPSLDLTANQDSRAAFLPSGSPRPAAPALVPCQSPCSRALRRRVWRVPRPSFRRQSDSQSPRQIPAVAPACHECSARSTALAALSRSQPSRPANANVVGSDVAPAAAPICVTASAPVAVPSRTALSRATIRRSSHRAARR